MNEPDNVKKDEAEKTSKDKKSIKLGIDYRTINIAIAVFVLLATSLVTAVFVYKNNGIFATELMTFITVIILFLAVIGIKSDSERYASKISADLGSREFYFKFGPFELSIIGSPTAEKSEKLSQDSDDPNKNGKNWSIELDGSSAESVFKVSHRRLLNEAIRINSISTRNLMFGIMFSAIALAILSLPLLEDVVGMRNNAQSYIDTTSWTLKSYIPRLSVGILFQFVGFFFLRLYVANELDMKHNKNELTNIEMKLASICATREFDIKNSGAEIIKSLSTTERNFILKKDERSVSSDNKIEHNDIKNLIESIFSKQKLQ